MKAKTVASGLFKTAGVLSGIGTIITGTVVDKAIQVAVGDLLPTWAVTVARTMVASAITGVGVSSIAALFAASESLDIDEAAIIEEALNSINFGIDGNAEVSAEEAEDQAVCSTA